MKLWTITGIIGVAAVAAVAGRALPQGVTPLAPKAAAGDDALRREVAALRLKVAELDRADRSALLAASVQPPGDAPAAEGASPKDVGEATEPGSGPSPEEKNREIAEDIGARFAAEPVDAAWRLGMMRRLRDALESSAGGGHVDDLDCAATLCRIVLRHDGPDAQREVGALVAPLEPFRAGVFFDYDRESAPPKTTLYVLREGYTFADLRHSSL
jgi:hypothetical protein